jgi:diguanylate cyclase
VTPVEIARHALHRLAELGLPPTPENYQAQYRAIAGVPADPASRAAPADSADTLQVVRALLQIMAHANDGLHADLTRFSNESSDLLARVEKRTENADAGELFQAMAASSTWLLNQVDATRHELTAARQQLDQMHQELEQAQSMAITDPLTALPNRRGIEIALSREMSRARRTKSSLCLAIIDIDHFKRVNDEFGHAAGDRALVHLARVTSPTIRETDVLGRYGGEEFLLVLPDTELGGAAFVLKRLLTIVERTPLDLDGRELRILFSAGLTQWQDTDTAERLITRADQAMYRAKEAGRARIAVAEGSDHQIVGAEASAAKPASMVS